MNRKLSSVTAIFLLATFMAGCSGIFGDNRRFGSGTGGDTGGGAQGNGLRSINHIVFMIQENRSFDSYFGKLNDYHTANGLPADVDGLPVGASNPTFDGTGAIEAFHMVQKCSENLSASWNESHVDANRTTQTDTTPFTMDGFVKTAAKFARDLGLVDTEGRRAMGYYDNTDLPYYYFMASNFATSDRWFSPAPTRTQPNRMYSLAATSEGHAYPPNAPLTSKTIFQLLEENNITWKVYTTENGNTYLKYFDSFYQAHKDKVVSVDVYKTDIANGTLPQVALIESGFETAALDEHPDNDIQKGSAYVASLVNALMTSPSWKDSVFILTYDEAGGLYDHVPPMATVNPDGIPPQDLAATDIQGDFTRTGFRVPLIVISPFTKKGYVSHTPADYTAIHKFIETRFGLGSLTKRDAMQMDMTEFFDFNNPAWLTPPSPPAQPVAGPNNCSQLP